jgi:hypothetical protein
MHAYAFCSRCLSKGHRVTSCTNSVRCIWCFGYGHKKSSCFHRWVSQNAQWVLRETIITLVATTLEPPAEVMEGTLCFLRQADALNTHTLSKMNPLLLTANAMDCSLSLLSTSAHPSLEIMENFTINLEPFVPLVMVIVDGGPLRRARREVYIRGGVAKTHEGCAIVVVNGDMSMATRH